MAGKKKTKTAAVPGKRGPGRPPGSTNKSKAGAVLSPLGEASVVDSIRSVAAAFTRAPDAVIALLPAELGTRVVVGDDKESEPTKPVFAFALTAGGRIAPVVHEPEMRALVLVPDGLVKALLAPGEQ